MRFLFRLCFTILPLLTLGEIASACSSVQVTLPSICLSEGFDPKTEEFKQCVIDLIERKTEESRDLLLDPCLGGKSHRLMLVPNEVQKEFEFINEEYLKEKNYSK